MKSKENIDHMTMPRGPGAMFIMIHSQLAFSLLKALLDGPAHEGCLAHFRKRHIDGCIGEGEFGLPLRSNADKEPDRLFLGQTISRRVDPQAGHLGDDGALGPLGQDDRFPVAFARAGKGGNRFGLGLAGGKSRAFGFSSPPRVRGHTDLRFF